MREIKYIYEINFKINMTVYQKYKRNKVSNHFKSP